MIVIKRIKYLWAKKSQKNGRFLWLPLMQHLEDTKNVSLLLWENWLSEGQKKIIINSIVDKDEKKAKQLVKFLGYVHDIGKATPSFQTMEGFTNSSDLDYELLSKLEYAGFKGITSKKFVSRGETRHNIAGQFILSNFGVRDEIATIVGGHHGKTIDNINECMNQSAYKANYYQDEENTDVNALWHQCHYEIFNEALNLCGYGSVDEIPAVGQPAQVILLGLLVVADWIASNEEYYPLIDINKDEVEEKDHRRSCGFKEWIKSDLWQPDENVDFISMYNNRFDFDPRNVQEKLSEVITECDEPGIFILEAPMGIGKTEAALIGSEQLAAKTGRSGLFFGLPTQATSNGIFPRIITWLNSIKEDYGDTLQVRLAHGKAHLNDSFTSIASGIGIDGDGSIIVNQWFSGKKTTALDDFVVGTVDQFLLLSLKQKHLFLRHLGFSKKVVIIDEVHAYDTYMSQYLKESLTWMASYGVPVILLSATLPSKSRSEIILSYLMGRSTKISKPEREEVKVKLENRAYPLITYTDGNNVKTETQFVPIENKMVKVNSIDEDGLIQLVESMIKDGGVVGIIVNTVKRGQNFAKMLSDYFGDDLVLLLHSGFIATERVKKENELLSIIGKKASRPERKIIIGTQVIEQSLDIDFDVLISDLAPVDLLIQRIGRLHRHDERIKPASHTNPRLYILGKNSQYDFEEGSRNVYGDYLLMRTQYFIDKYSEIAIPGDISDLVQDVYSDDDIDFSGELKERYTLYKENNKELKQHKENIANTFRIDNPIVSQNKKRIVKKNNLIGWINKGIMDNSDEKGFAQVRDGEQTIEVIVVKKIGDGYGVFDSDEDISKKINDEIVAKNIARNTLTLPRFFSAVYNIDKTIDELEKYNNKNLSKWQKSIWLKGCLGIVLDENNEFVLCGKCIKYDEKYGICILEEGSD